MSLDTDLTIGFGIIGLAVAVFAIVDNRRQRTEREKAVIAARATIERITGLLIGIKPALDLLAPGLEPAINDGLDAIKQERARLDAL